MRVQVEGSLLLSDNLHTGHQEVNAAGLTEEGNLCPLRQHLECGSIWEELPKIGSRKDGSYVQDSTTMSDSCIRHGRGTNAMEPCKER